MTRYLVQFTPMEPYFFGDERTLKFLGRKNSYTPPYFVRSEQLPSQSTLLGALRFMLLQCHGRAADCFKTLSDEEQRLIGSKGFNADAQGDIMGYGVIKGLSPVFLVDESNERFIPVPKDHCVKAKSETEQTDSEENRPEMAADEKAAKPEAPVRYEPFKVYREMNTLDGAKLYTEEYNIKEGVANGFVALSTGNLAQDLFSAEIRVGINRGKMDDGFFKKEYVRLKDGLSFAVYADMEGDDEGDDEFIAKMVSQARTVYLGQGKAAFLVRFSEAQENQIEEETRKFLEEHHPASLVEGALVYCLSDAFMVSGDAQDDMYRGALFAVTDTKTYRSIETRLNDDAQHLIRKPYESGNLYNLMKAGSVLIFKNEVSAAEWIKRYSKPAFKIIGYNAFITITICKEERK